MRVALPNALGADILTAARVAHPRECCGLLVGARHEDMMHIIALHPVCNLSDDPHRFQIDPADHIAAQKAARDKGYVIIGCYHSHPDGQAEPSAVDLAGAQEAGFLWLIAAGETLNAFVYLGGRFTGADWVTSSE